MKNNLFILTNESIYIDENKNFFCDNIDLKSIPEELNEFANVLIIGRYSNKKRSKKINLKKINIPKNIFSYLFCIFKNFKNKNDKYLIISISPFTFFASILLKLFLKKHFIYLRSNGFEEYKAILGWIGPSIYKIMFSMSTIKASLISCRKHLLKKNNGAVVSPSQLNEKWFKNFKELNFSDNKLLYVGRLRVEKGIFSLIKILEGSKINLTIVSSERKINIKENYKNISFINFKNNNDEIIKIYDEHKILILPSFTESHPQVLDEALARGRPVIIFKDIQHVKRDREGVFVIDRNLKSLNEKINYINNNYKSINKKIKKNKLPTKKSFIRELKKILLN